MTDHNDSTDLRGWADLVSKALETGYGIERAPAAADYQVVQGEGVLCGPRIQIEVDLGKGIRTRIGAALRPDCVGEREKAELAEKLAHAVARFHRRSVELRSVERMVKRRIAKAVESGIPCRVVSMEVTKMNADNDFSPGLIFKIEALDASLRPGQHEMGLLDRKNCKDVFKSFDREQADRLEARNWLAGCGGNAAIEWVLLNALKKAGVPSSELWSEIFACRDGDTAVVGSDGTRFSIHWRDGVVVGRVVLAPGVTWNRGYLNFDTSPRQFDKRVIDRPVVDIYQHPFLSGKSVIWDARGKRGRSGELRCSMRIWVFRLLDDGTAEKAVRNLDPQA